MAWVRIDDDAWDHPKHVAAGPMAFALWTWGLLYSSKHLTDGALSIASVRRSGVPKAEHEAQRLVDAGLWETVDGGYLIHDYHDYNPSKAQVDEKRKRANDRIEAWRKRNGNAHGNADVTPFQTPVKQEINTTPVPVPVPVPVPQEPVHTHNAREAPLGARREHAAHALCGRVCLPGFVLREFLNAKGGDEDTARAYVDVWAMGQIRAIAPGGPREAEVIGDGVKWWRYQWEASHPTAKARPAGPAEPTQAEKDAAFLAEGARRQRIKDTLEGRVR